MEFESSRWRKLKRVLAICSGIWIVVVVIGLIEILPHRPTGWKEWLLYIFVLAPGGLLLELLGEALSSWVGRRFSRVQIYGFFIIAGLAGVFLAFYFVPR